jgi:site-specific recombinase XerD
MELLPRQAHRGSIDRHGASWRWRVRVAGKRHVYRLEVGDYPEREDVEDFAVQEYARLRRRNGKGLPGPVPFSELLARYRESELDGLAAHSRRSYETSLQAFETYFVKEGGDPQTDQIRPGHVHGFMTWRRTHSPNGTKRDTPLAARTVAKDRVVLHVVFSLAETLEMVPGNPVRKTKPPKGDAREPIILSEDQYEALIRATQGRHMLRLYVMVLGEAGLRCDSEALWLRWQDVDLERGFLAVESVRKGRRTKSGKSRKVPMTRRLREAMQEHMARYRMKTYSGERTEWVFHHELRRRHAKPGARITGLRRAFGGAVKRAGLPADLRQHDLRHRRVTTWLAEGHPITLVQKAMGHSTVRVTEGYAHLVDEDLLPLVAERQEDQLRAMVER